MSQDTVAPGKYVSLTYVIRDLSDNILEQHDTPVGYIFGGEQELIGGMETLVKGKKAGDSVEMQVPPEQGFGPHDPSLTFTDDLSHVPEEFHHLGAEVQMQSEDGEIKSFFVTKIENGKLTVDGNHPMAGKTLKVKVRIVEVRDATDIDRQTIALQHTTPNTIH